MCRIRLRLPTPTKSRSPKIPASAPSRTEHPGPSAHLNPFHLHHSHPPSRQLGGPHPAPIRSTAEPDQPGEVSAGDAGTAAWQPPADGETHPEEEPQPAPAQNHSEHPLVQSKTRTEGGSFSSFAVPCWPNPLPLPSRKLSSPTQSHARGQQVEMQKISKIGAFGFFFPPPKKTQAFPRKSSINMRIVAGGGRSQRCPSARGRRGEVKKKHQKKKENQKLQTAA